jgi:MFS family permease
MWAAAGVLTTVYILGTLPSPLYVVYRQAFGFSELTLTLVYASFVIGTLAAMLFAGRLSDEIGRRPLVWTSLAVSVVADVLFLCAVSTGWLFAARIVSGLAVGFASGASTAWIVELHPRRDRIGGTQAAVTGNVLGLALGPLIAGVLAQWAPMPLRLSYLVWLALVPFEAAAIGLSKESRPAQKRLRQASLRPHLGVPPEVRKGFVAPAIAAFATFAVLGFYTALIPSLLARSLHIKSHAAAGAVVAGLFLTGVAVLTTAPRLNPHRGLAIGLALLIPGTALLVGAEFAHSLLLLLLATVVGGAASGLGYFYGLRVVNEIAPEDRRSELVSTYLVVCYLAISMPVIGIGVVSTIGSPPLATAIFGGVVALLAATALLFELLRSHAPRTEQHSTS